MTTLEERVEHLTELITHSCIAARDCPARRPPNRIFPRTQAEFDRLPLLVSLQEFLDWTGLDRGYVSDEVRAGRIKVLRLRHYCKYYKTEIARLGRYTL